MIRARELIGEGSLTGRMKGRMRGWASYRLPREGAVCGRQVSQEQGTRREVGSPRGALWAECDIIRENCPGPWLPRKAEGLAS